VASFYNIGDLYTRCVRGHLFEDAIHFFLECPLYQHDRTSMFNHEQALQHPKYE
jgi:hypothetical protein